MDELLSALAGGSSTGLLAALHIPLLQLVQADMGGLGAGECAGEFCCCTCTRGSCDHQRPHGCLALPPMPPAGRRAWLHPIQRAPMPPRPLVPSPPFPYAHAEEEHAMQSASYAVTTAQAVEQRGDSRFIAVAHMLEEAWSWCAGGAGREGGPVVGGRGEARHWRFGGLRWHRQQHSRACPRPARQPTAPSAPARHAMQRCEQGV